MAARWAHWLKAEEEAAAAGTAGERSVQWEGVSDFDPAGPKEWDGVLTATFHEKDFVKERGAFYDGVKKKWRVPVGNRLRPFGPRLPTVLQRKVLAGVAAQAARRRERVVQAAEAEKARALADALLDVARQQEAEQRSREKRDAEEEKARIAEAAAREAEAARATASRRAAEAAAETAAAEAETAAQAEELARSRQKPATANAGTCTREDKKLLYHTTHTRAPGAKRNQGGKSQHATASEDFLNGEVRRMAAKLTAAAHQLLESVAEAGDLARGGASDPGRLETGQMLCLRRGGAAAVAAVKGSLDDQATLERREKARKNSARGKADREKRFNQKHLSAQKAKGPEGGKKRKRSKRLGPKHAAAKRRAGGRGLTGGGRGGRGRGSGGPSRSRSPAGRSYSRSHTPQRRAAGRSMSRSLSPANIVPRSERRFSPGQWRSCSPGQRGQRRSCSPGPQGRRRSPQRGGGTQGFDLTNH